MLHQKKAGFCLQKRHLASSGLTREEGDRGGSGHPPQGGPLCPQGCVVAMAAEVPTPAPPLGLVSLGLNQSEERNGP